MWRYIAAAFIPFSIECSVWAGVELTVPVEPLLLITGIGMIISGAYRRIPIQWLSLIIGVFWIGWWWISACFADRPWVAFKYVTAETLVAVVCIVGALANRRVAWRVLLIYTIATVVLHGGIVIRHGWSYSFRADQANLAGIPFYFDHNLYAAIAITSVLLLPAAVGFSNSTKAAITVVERYPNVCWIFAVFIAAISTSRGALLSVLLSAWLFQLVFTAGCKRWLWGAAGLIALSIGLSQWEHVRRDVSAMERLNRYTCVAAIVEAHPLTGVGPGNFPFSYLAYQQPQYQTRISVQAPLERRGPHNYGRGGGAHSEYGRWLAEMGWVGWCLGCTWNGWLAWQLWQRRNQPGWRWLGAAMCTLWIHSWVNDFFHEPRLGLLYWLMAGLVLSQKYKTSDNFNKNTSNFPQLS
jgi:O-Antigen ligase